MPTCDIAIIIVCAGRHGTTERRAGAPGMNTKYEALREELSRTEDKVREYNRMKVHESFPVMRLTPELLDEYVDSIEVHPGNDVRVIWK